MAEINSWGFINFHWSSRHAVVYLAFSKKSHNRFALYKALHCLGDVFLTDGDEAAAENLFVVALEGFTYMDVHRCRAECMLRRGDIAKKQGNQAKAIALWKEAQPLFERSSQAKSVVQIDARLADLEKEHEAKPEHLVELDASTTSLENLLKSSHLILLPDVPQTHILFLNPCNTYAVLPSLGTHPIWDYSPEKPGFRRNLSFLGNFVEAPSKV
jgi:hypothetical protein